MNAPSGGGFFTRGLYINRTHISFPPLSAAWDLAVDDISWPGSPALLHPGQARRLCPSWRASHGLCGSFGMVSRSDSRVVGRSEGRAGPLVGYLWVLKSPGRTKQSPFAAQGGPLALQGRRRLRWAGDSELVDGGNWTADGRTV